MRKILGIAVGLTMIAVLANFIGCIEESIPESTSAVTRTPAPTETEILPYIISKSVVNQGSQIIVTEIWSEGYTRRILLQGSQKLIQITGSGKWYDYIYNYPISYEPTELTLLSEQNINGNYKVQDVSGDIITINGNYNEIKILNVDVSLIRLNGNYNTVYYPKGARPTIRENGFGNEIKTY